MPVLAIYYISFDNFDIFPSYDRFAFGIKADSASHVALRYWTD